MQKNSKICKTILIHTTNSKTAITVYTEPT